jgi:hypothetical protein
MACPGAIDGHIVGNLKFAAGQQNRTGYTGSVDRVTVIRGGERVAQGAWATVIRVCDYYGVCWQRIANFN